MAKKISHLSVDAILAHKTFSRDNTQVIKDDDGDYHLYLFGNEIIKHTHDNRLFITTANWNTRTTRDRLNALPNVWISSVKKEPTINGNPWNGKWTEIIIAGPVLILSQ